VPGTGVRAHAEGERWRLTGESRFSSGIDIIDRALVPGWLDDEKHLLFDIDAALFDPDRSSWHTAAMDASRSFTVRVDVRADGEDVVGPPCFYLDRRGFAIGGLEVAAVWAGGARSVLELVAQGLRQFRPTSHQTRRVGVMEQAVWQADLVVAATAARLPELDGDDLVRETAAARTAVVIACEQVLDEAIRVVGPAGLSGNGRLARTVADLTIYVRQHHLDLTFESRGREALLDREATE
jgi:alkylation response protein AidB-like acyl-CoA dehydrogenase